MDKKHQIHNLLILDESGSMEDIKRTIIQGFNEIVQTIIGIEKEFPEQEHFISFVTFNGLGHKTLHFNEPVSTIEPIDEKRYRPQASTPLYDAMGFSFFKLRQLLESHDNYNVLVTILTDGQENTSREYSGAGIKKLVEELKLNNWTFTYIGADHDIEAFASSISIDNTMRFEKNQKDIDQMFVREKSARVQYSLKIRSKQDTGGNFYNSDEPSEKIKSNNKPFKEEPNWWQKLFGLK